MLGFSYTTGCLPALQHLQPAAPVACPHPCLTAQVALQYRPQNRNIICRSISDVKSAVNELKQARFGVAVDPAYTTGAAYLKTLGLNNPAEIARILDIAMNPNSLFVDYGGKRSTNPLARSLDVDKDMRPVVDFMLTKGLSKGDVLKIVSAHPPVLSYDVNGRLEPFWAYLEEIGVQDVGAALAKRPTLLGLNVEASRKIVGYLQSIETPPELIVKYLVESI